jgi:hypothetical protein
MARILPDPPERSETTPKEPARMAYGGTDAVFDDTCGNLLNLHQD